MNNFYILFLSLIFLQASFSYAKAIGKFDLNIKFPKFPKINNGTEIFTKGQKEFVSFFNEINNKNFDLKSELKDILKNENKTLNTVKIQKRDDSYAYDYFRAQLNSFETYIYDGFLHIARNYESFPSNTFQVKVQNLKTLKIKSSEIEDRLVIAFRAFAADYPQYWWVDKYGYADEYDGNYVNHVILELTHYGYSIKTIQKMTAKINKTRETFLELNLDEYSDFVKYKTFHEVIARLNTYLSDTSSAKGSSYNSIYGPLVDKKSVCEGYARTFKYFSDIFYLKTTLFYAFMNTKDNMNASRKNKLFHVSNYVNLNGKWYGVDVLGDDKDDEKKITYNYFLIGSKTKLPNGLLFKEERDIDKTLGTFVDYFRFSYPGIQSKEYKMDRTAKKQTKLNWK